MRTLRAGVSALHGETASAKSLVVLLGGFRGLLVWGPDKLKKTVNRHEGKPERDARDFSNRAVVPVNHDAKLGIDSPMPGGKSRNQDRGDNRVGDCTQQP